MPPPDRQLAIYATCVTCQSQTVVHVPLAVLDRKWATPLPVGGCPCQKIIIMNDHLRIIHSTGSLTISLPFEDP